MMPAVRSFLVVVMMGFVSPCAIAAENVSGLSDPDHQARFRELAWELRCPKCQNQNIADSNAPVAEDLRSEIVRLLKEGRSNSEIVEYMVARYGEFVRYQPRAAGINLLLWVLPLLGLVIGAAVIVLRARQGDAAPGALSDEEQARLDALLQAEKEDDGPGGTSR